MKKILIIQTAFIGDVILATPLIEKLDLFYPDSKIDFLLRKGNEGLLKHHPKLNQMIIWDKASSKYNALAKISKKVRAEKYDLLVNLQRFTSSGMITMASNAKMLIGFSKNPMSFGFTHKLPHAVGKGVHEIERNLSLIEHITDGNILKPVLYPSPEDYEKVKPYQASTYVCIAPSSVWFTKQLPVEKWVELLNEIKPNYNIYLLGAPNDLELCAQIKRDSTHEKIRILAGELSFLQSAALMKSARMNYVNDSAPMHMASAMNAPVTAVYCSTVPDFGFGPLSEESHIVQVKEELECRPCGLHGKKACPKEHFKCAYDIEIEQFPIK